MEQVQTNSKGFRWEFRNCVDCGKKFVAKNYNSVRCYECQGIHKAKTEKERKKAKKAKSLIIVGDYSKKNDPNICRRTVSCKYGGRMGGIKICNYLEVTGERRPCPVKDCVVYERGKQIKREKVRLYRL